MELIVVDYGVGNIGSIINMLKYIGVHAELSKDKNKILSADKLLLPGVGKFNNGMCRLKESGVIELLAHKVFQDKTPILGICLGMQLFFEKSEEGNESGLGWMKGAVQHFHSGIKKNIHVPHMGWNVVTSRHSNSLFYGLEDPKFYFAHSYYVSCVDQENILGTTNYGGNFVSSVQCNNMVGTQFHPEKSHKFGIQLLKNFIERV